MLKKRRFCARLILTVAALTRFSCDELLAAKEQASPLPAIELVQEEGARSAASPADPELGAEQSSGSRPGVDIVLPEGRLEAVLARDETASSPVDEFIEDAKQIYVVLRSSLVQPASVQMSWIAVNVEGIHPNEKLGDSKVRLAPGQSGIITIGAPEGGFSW